MNKSTFPLLFKFDTACHPSGWSFVNLTPDGEAFTKRLTKDMLTFDLNRSDIQVNAFGVVLFHDRGTARSLLNDAENTVAPLSEIDVGTKLTTRKPTKSPTRSSKPAATQML